MISKPEVRKSIRNDDCTCRSTGCTASCTAPGSTSWRSLSVPTRHRPYFSPDRRSTTSNCLRKENETSVEHQNLTRASAARASPITTEKQIKNSADIAEEIIFKRQLRRPYPKRISPSDDRFGDSPIIWSCRSLSLWTMSENFEFMKTNTRFQHRTQSTSKLIRTTFFLYRFHT